MDRKHIPAALVHAAKAHGLRDAHNLSALGAFRFLVRSLRKVSFVNTNVFFLQSYSINIPYCCRITTFL